MNLKKFDLTNLKQNTLKVLFLIFISFYFIIYNFITYESNSNAYKIERHGSLESNQVTVISQYFHLTSNLSNEEKTWIRNFFLSVSAPLVIFTDGHCLRDLLELRNILHMPTSLYVTDSIWNLMQENEIKRQRNYVYIYMNKQQDLDDKTENVSSAFYALRNLKTFLIEKIARENFYESSTFIYSDSNDWKEKVLANWPNQELISNLKKVLQDKILLVKHFQNESKIGNEFFMGSQKALSYFKERFWQIHDELFDRGEFVDNERILSYIYQENHASSHTATLNVWKRECSSITNETSFYQNFLAWNKYYPCFGSRESLLDI
jgi:hypothetical protein